MNSQKKRKNGGKKLKKEDMAEAVFILVLIATNLITIGIAVYFGIVAKHRKKIIGHLRTVSDKLQEQMLASMKNRDNKKHRS